MKQSGIRLGGPIFGEIRSIEEAVTKHKRTGFAASFVDLVEDPVMREEYIRAFAEADIVLAELGAYCINVLDTNPEVRRKNIDEICRKLEQADMMGAKCCVMHGGSYQTGGWGDANPENLSERAFIETVEIIQSIIDRVKPETTRLVIETESYVLPDSPEVYSRLIDAVDRQELAVHLDPVNIISDPRRYCFNDQFIRRCFAVLGDRIVSCHAKDVNMPPVHATVQIDETYIGNGTLNYEVYLKEIVKLDPVPTLMIEHLDAPQLIQGLNYIYRKAEECGVEFVNSDERDISS